MVTSVIGKIFLQAYNEKNGTAYAPKDFFMEIYYPLFFKEEKYLMTAGNSPFENPKLSWKDMILGKKPFETAERREERLRKFIDKIDTGLADASIAVGYPSIDTLSTTSGQISIPQEQIDPAESYLSWIGAGLGVGVEGGLTILFDKPELLLDIFEGWKVYRGFLNTTPKMKGNQINTWNAQWLNKKYNPIDTSEIINVAILEKDGLMGIDTLPWGELLVAISRHFSDPKMMGYVYNIGQTNTTVGFIPFALSPIRNAHQLYVRYFGADKSDEAMRLLGTAHGFSLACRGGEIGIKALEPKGLKAIMDNGRIPSYKTDNEKRIKVQTYQIWLLAMLSNEELWSKAKEFAQALRSFEQGHGEDRTNRDNAIEELLSHPSKRAFVWRLIPILKDAEIKERKIIMDISKIIHDMPAENVPYFIGLTKIHYIMI
ncbi:hypothetical protein [Porphyromonas loveana]|uniref:Uncharacterized protein n=1 Tax=Porphyromonas loveana TaxID=1884669 RepID=A0A2U1F9F0_9PORP|nr:hypothetical protein [Porphyromonas loveana]PVZ08794.1 hypothetical protein C7382_11141 [Porphyromonas loveana]